MVVRKHSLWGGVFRNLYFVEEVQVESIACPECIHPAFKDVGAFINHMSKKHNWIPSKTLMYWGDYYRGDDDVEKQGETTEAG